MTSNRDHAGKSIGEPLIIPREAAKSGYGADEIEIPCSDVNFMAEEAVGDIGMLFSLLISRHLDVPPSRNVRTEEQIVDGAIHGFSNLVTLGFHLAERAVLAAEYGKELVAQAGDAEVETEI